MAAVKYGDLEACEELLEKSKGQLMADVNAKGEQGWSPLHFACLNGNVSMVKLLILNDADLEIENKTKSTPLLVTCEKGDRTIAKLLIDCGANINAADVYHNTPLHYATHYGKALKSNLLEN